MPPLEAASLLDVKIVAVHHVATTVEYYRVEIPTDWDSDTYNQWYGAETPDQWAVEGAMDHGTYLGWTWSHLEAPDWERETEIKGNLLDCYAEGMVRQDLWQKIYHSKDGLVQRAMLSAIQGMTTDMPDFEHGAGI